MRRALLFVTIVLAAGVAWLALAEAPAPRMRSQARPVAQAREPAEVAPPTSASTRTAEEAPAPPPAATTELVVRTRRGFGKDAERVPGIDFEVLRLVGAAVDVAGPFGTVAAYEPGERLALGETDAEGLARVALPGDVPLDERGSPLVLVRVVEPGHQQHTDRARVPRDGSVPEARPSVVPGATARGRVLDAAGAPAEARVRAERWYEDANGRRLAHVAGGSTLAGGRFELHLRESAFAATVSAESETLGSAALTGVDLPLDAPPQDLELTLVGAGALRGRVLGADGRGVAGLPLLVRLAELEGGPLGAVEPAASLRRAEGRGRTECLLATDAEGHFALRGLRREPYVVRAKAGNGAGYGYATRLTPRPVVAADAEVELQLSEPQLVVRLLDAEGRPWRGEPPHVGSDAFWFGDRYGWEAKPRVRVLPLDPAGVVDAAPDEPLPGRRNGGHEAVFSVRAGARYAVVVQGEDFTAAPLEVEVPPQGGETRVDVRASPARGWSVVVPAIRRTPQGGRFAIAEAFLEDPATGVRLCDLDAKRGESEHLRAPPGRYRLVAEGCASVDTHHGTLFARRAHGRTELELDIAADARLEVPLELGPGARLELELAGEPNAADRAAVERTQPWLLEPNNLTMLPEAVASARVWLTRPQRAPQTVERVIEIEGSSSAGEHLQPAWPLGLRATSEVVSPGTWTLVARLPGGREVSREVELRAGETTQVRLAFAD